MATILEGLNQIAEKLGGAESTSNLEALNAISGALGGSADAENNADAIANIAENASGGGGGGDGKMGSFTFTNGIEVSEEGDVAPWSLEQGSGAINLVQKPVKANESVKVNVPLFDGHAPQTLVLVTNFVQNATKVLKVECTNCTGRVVEQGLEFTILALNATRENLEAGNASVRMYYG